MGRGTVYLRIGQSAQDESESAGAVLELELFVDVELRKGGGGGYGQVSPDSSRRMPRTGWSACLRGRRTGSSVSGRPIQR